MILLGMPILCHADSLLTPTEFPKTFQDLEFTDQATVKAEDYAYFADLSPYDILTIVAADEGINEELLAEELAEQTQTLPSTGTPQTTNPNQLNPVNNTPPSSTPGPLQPIPGTNPYYCQQMNPYIPKNQKYPIGKPVLESDYKFCSAYGVRNFGTKEHPKYDNHYGFDIGCGEVYFDRPVFTPADGIVEKAQPNHRGSSAGNYIVINHQNGFKTLYIHLNTMLVTKGQYVTAGCQIATIGNTGGAKINKAAFKDNPYPTMKKSISHLHYEVHYKGALKSVPGPDGSQIRILHKFSGHASIDPAYMMCVKK